jgi:hypothetical protein
MWDKLAEPQLLGSATSYFSEPEHGLDPKLFDGTHLKPSVRNGLLSLVFDFLSERYAQPDLWVKVWLAGSGASYQWSAQRDPADLDVLLGIDYIQFRKAHPRFAGLSNAEISAMLNEEFYNDLQPEIEHWNDYEVTVYSNPGATDITVIKPYAAYDVTHDEWTVYPSHTPVARNAKAEAKADRDYDLTSDIIKRYSQSISDLHGAQNDAARRNAEFRTRQALSQASALYEDIHGGRKIAFSPSGEGYSDFNNYRWQAGKRLGTVQALKQMHHYWSAAQDAEAQETYGVELPDTQTLIRRAILYRS